MAISTKAINDTLGPEGIVPSAFVFGELPSIRAFIGPKVPRAILAERAVSAQEARKLISKHLAQSKIKRAERHRTPTATDHVYYPGDQVLVWMLKQINNRIGTY